MHTLHELNAMNGKTLLLLLLLLFVTHLYCSDHLLIYNPDFIYKLRALFTNSGTSIFVDVHNTVGSSKTHVA